MLKEHILGVVADHAISFMVYDRKYDEDLPREALENALRDGTISTAEVAQEFKKALDRYLED